MFLQNGNVKVGLGRRKRHPSYDGTEEFNYFLSVLFAADELQIFPYHRIVANAGHPPRAILDKLSDSFVVEARAASPSGGLPLFLHGKGDVGMYMEKQWYRLRARPHLFRGDPVGDLDVSILQEQVLEPLFDIHDPKCDPNISFIGGVHGEKDLMEMADSSPGSVVFSMYPTSMEELLAVADAGGLMPPKSTWFEPKLRSGLFIHEIEA